MYSSNEIRKAQNEHLNILCQNLNSHEFNANLAHPELGVSEKRTDGVIDSLLLHISLPGFETTSLPLAWSYYQEENSNIQSFIYQDDKYKN